MNILILGGTVFLGRHLVKSAKDRNHNITLFTRGMRNPEIFPEVEKLRGDRHGNLDSLKGRKFDAVIDTSGHIPADVKNSAELLRESGQYIFISSISAYKDFSTNGIDESYDTLKVTNGNVSEMTMENYGALKVLCEEEVSKVFKERALNIRPGLIVGEFDWSDRFTYWIHRVDKGGEVAAPESKHFHTQFIDARDLADWIITCAENKTSGLYNATGPGYGLTFEKFLNECKNVTNSDAEIVWMDEKFLLDQNVAPWTELPMWVPSEEQGVNNVSISKALDKGLTFRKLSDTIEETLRFDKSRVNYSLRSGLKPEKEKELLEKWKQNASV